MPMNHKARHIFIVEDDEDICQMITYNLEKEGYRVSSLDSGNGAARAMGRDLPDLVLLDIMLPGTDGLDVLRELRAGPLTEALPIIMLTAKSQEADKVVGLELGADDYMVKPFSPRELVARIKAVLRRTSPPREARPRMERPATDIYRMELSSGGLVIDSKKQKVTLRGEAVSLTATEFKLLELLGGSPGEVFTRERILDAVFGYSTDAYERTVDTHIKTLRKKLGPARDVVETVRGTGYRLREI